MNSIVAAVFVLSCALAANAAWIPEMENSGFFEGDILLDPDEKKKSGNAFGSIIGGRWPGARIPYSISSDIGSQGRTAISNAIAQYHQHTCLRFHLRRTNENSFIYFHRGSGCSSPVGYRKYRRNSISLAPGCWYSHVVMHEIGHSIGLHHEQNRPDRDYYVNIIRSNIQQGMAFNFDKQSYSTVDSLKTLYDYNSIMHYGSTAFGNGRLTIQTKDPSKQNIIGSARVFSATDINQINLMYCGGGGGGGGTGTGTACSDKSTNCMTYINYCRVSSWLTHMQTNCRKTCRYCV